MFAGPDTWAFGEPDLVVDTPSVSMKANAPDWWGLLQPVSTGLKEDRYVSVVQIKEISNVKGGLGGKFIFHHAIHAMINPDGTPGEPIGSPHEVGRNTEYFEPEAGRLMKAGSKLVFPSVHVHANSQDTTAHLRVGYKFHPAGYQPKRRVGGLIVGNGELDLKPMTAGQEVHLYATLQRHTMLTTFEPHMHAAGVRMCIEAIWGGRTETLSCAGYDHNWVRVYRYADRLRAALAEGHPAPCDRVFRYDARQPQRDRSSQLGWARASLDRQHGDPDLTDPRAGRSGIPGGNRESPCEVAPREGPGDARLSAVRL